MDKEFKTTLSVVIVALVALVFAWIVQPRRVVSDLDTSELGTEFFQAFTNPLSATSLEVISFDESEGKVNEFMVERTSTGWVIPSKSGYAADDDNQMEKSAGALVGLQILSKESDNPGEHADYGVLDPTQATASDTGVGTLVRMKDEKGAELAQLIVGKEVSDRTNLRYVRRPLQDRVYTAEISLDNLSTKFADWVERDFLDLNAFNVREVLIDDHEIDEAQGIVSAGAITRLSYNTSDDPDWSLIAHQSSKGSATNQLPAGKMLDEEKLNNLRNALDDLEIVDVVSKPELLVPGLREGKDAFSNLDNQLETMVKAQELQSRGFFPVNTPEGLKIYSNEGQIKVTMDDGVQYVLRFGEVAQDTESKGDKESPLEKNNNRYLFVIAQPNTAQLEKPEIKPIPDMPTLEDVKNELVKESEGKEVTDEDAQKELKSRTDALTQIKKDNEKAQADYDKKIEALNKRVSELNEKFAPWYYVIADDVYKKIKVDYEGILKVDEKSAAETNKKAGEDFLKANMGKEGIKVTDSGLQYKVLKAAEKEDSPKPTTKDTVKVKYRGTLIDGTEFDAGETSFPVTGVIKGWTEGLQLMQVGSKFQFFIPSDLAYGETGSGPKIGPNSALIFEVELLGLE